MYQEKSGNPASDFNFDRQIKNRKNLLPASKNFFFFLARCKYIEGYYFSTIVFGFCSAATSKK
jgi:hypothetical protein